MADTYRMEVDPDGNVSFFHNERLVFYCVAPKPYSSGFSDSESIAIFDRPLSGFEIEVLNQAAGRFWELPEGKGEEIEFIQIIQPIDPEP